MNRIGIRAIPALCTDIYNELKAGDRAPALKYKCSIVYGWQLRKQNYYLGVSGVTHPTTTMDKEAIEELSDELFKCLWRLINYYTNLQTQQRETSE